MRYVFIVTLLVTLLLNVTRETQAQGSGTESYVMPYDITIDSTISWTKYRIPFYGARAVSSERDIGDETKLVPAAVWTTGEHLLYFLADSMDADIETDSLSFYVKAMTYEEKTVGDTIWLDFATGHDTSATQVWLDWTPHESQADTNHVYYWVDLTSEFEHWQGFELGVIQKSSGGGETKIRLRYIGMR